MISTNSIELNVAIRLRLEAARAAAPAEMEDRIAAAVEVVEMDRQAPERLLIYPIKVY